MANYMQYNKFDMANGLGIRSSVFFAGCSFHCKGCWNPASWNPNNGNPLTDEIIDEIVDNAEHEAIVGLSLLGGEPFQNLDGSLPLARKFKETYPDKNIWVWTGYLWEDIIAHPYRKEILEYIDVLIDGQFILAQRDLTLHYRGSQNQRIIDVQESLNKNSVILNPLN